MRHTILHFIIGVVLFLGACGLKTRTLEEFYEGDLSELSKIVIFDGNTGYKKIITDPGIISSFIDDIKDVKFIPDKNQEQRDGFNYAVTFYESDKQTFEFNLTQVEGHYYHTDPDLLPIVQDFYRQLDIAEE